MGSRNGQDAGLVQRGGLLLTLSRAHQVIHARVPREAELLAVGAVGDAADVERPGRPGGAAGELGRGQEAPPVVRAARQPAQQVLRADDRREEARRVRLSVERMTRPPGRVAGAGGEERRHVRDVLDDLERQHEVEAAPRRPPSSTGRLVGDLEPDLLGVPARATRCWPGVGSMPVTAAPSRVRGSASRPPPQPTSRTRSPASGRPAPVAARMAAGLVADIADADRVQPVQRAPSARSRPTRRGASAANARAPRDRRRACASP